MSLSDLASIGSLVSGIAVLVSLIFVGYQLRQNTAQMRRSELNTTMEQSSAWRLAVVSNNDVAELWVKGRSETGTLNAVEAERFDLLLEEALWLNFNIWDRSRNGLLDEGTWERSAADFLADLLIPARSARWWQSYKVRVPAAYASNLDTTIAARIGMDRR